TRIRREDGKDWAPLGAWPEFAETLKQQQEKRASSPPPLDSAQADQLADELIGNGYGVDVGGCFSRSWQLYQKNFGILTGTTALVLIILSLLHSVPGAGSIVSVALAGVFVAGLSLVFLNVIRGKPAEVNDLFVGFNRGFVPLLVAGILVSILTGVGLLLCILPGIYLLVAWMFVYPLILERGFDFWPAMELSRRIVHERWWELFALMLGVGLLLFIGVLVAVVGVFFTAPLAFGAIMYAYEDIFGQPTPPATPSPAG
ncbi:MAG TPA: hypothetical protein DCY13_06845, partial [Verrucomicrobiales bacterium]|nr:hypothetical protein [Verrucomicrobiales bacterium]